MKKKTKILIFVLVLAAAVLTAGSFGAGNYLVDYALYRQIRRRNLPMTASSGWGKRMETKKPTKLRNRP
ncbi:MAG: hypothetical protein ACLSA6_07155 [Holdemania massiliensis]